MLPPPVFARGITVTHAAGAIAPAVAEMSILLILLCQRQVHTLNRMLKNGESWDKAKNFILANELAGQRVGVIGAGYTGRQVIRLLRALDAEVWVYDPYLSSDRAAALDVHQKGLDEIFAQCPIVTLQAPPTAETYNMVGAKEARPAAGRRRLCQHGALASGGRGGASSRTEDRALPGRLWMFSTRSLFPKTARSGSWITSF